MSNVFVQWRADSRERSVHGCNVGDQDGDIDGVEVPGDSVGAAVGDPLLAVGAIVGDPDGAWVGDAVGTVVGDPLLAVGAIVGDPDGGLVGDAVGAEVGDRLLHFCSL
eukprot:gene17846-biopygen5669